MSGVLGSDALFHPPGELSRSGVLDVGLKCAHSCRFCYYSFMAEAASGGKGQPSGQHAALRHASFRSTEDSLRIIDLMAGHGLINFDITGGEPTMHKGLPDMVRRARERGMSVRVITLGQFLMQPGGGRERLLDALLEAGTTDFLFSLHSSTEEGFHAATRGSLKKVLAAMDALDGLGFQYSANTVIHAGNVAELPDIARLSAARGVYHHNFIVFNAYYRWDSPASIAGLQAGYPDIKGPLERAVEILSAAGVAVTIRYLPLCAAPELVRHIVGVVGVHHDPHEWMNRAGNSDREPEYCAEPLPVPVDAPRHIYALKRGERRLDFGADGNVDIVAERGDAFKVFPALCRNCAAMDYCDGLDPKYILLHGLSGLAPFADMPGSLPLTASRRAYLPAFLLKREPLADMRGAVAGVLQGFAPGQAVYPYASGPLLERPNTYQFAQCTGPGFLEAWRDSRRRALAALGPEQAPERVAEDISSAIILPGESGVLFAALRRGLARNDGSEALELLDRLVQRFEVTKRVYGSYAADCRAADKGDYLRLDRYVAFGVLLQEAYVKTSCLSYLNALLKLLDTVCARAASVPESWRGKAAWLLGREADFVAALEHGGDK
ncbi:MAG: radical SAM protein [Humidesulfovibrio sp.]|uniref:radical SAM protein n=1 Tax=Humidesulfovibrio sp. TaxID=2910988 RepID=UPI0027FF56A3|nr:radical SAM protein [Humidesulfovibrio sp.]MDQ7834356.1 radical SAM protein [Humidesulfovibrio sp.]